MPVTREGRLNDSMSRYQRALPAALTAAGAVVATRAQKIFILFSPKGVATGATYRSLGGEKKGVSPPFMEGGWMRVKVGPTTKYSWWLHFGRKPGRFPNMQAIRDWVKEKHIPEEAAFPIARSIAEKGTEPFPFLTTAFRQSKDAALRTFSQMLAQGIIKGGKGG